MLSLYYSISLICVQKDAIISAGRMVSSAKGLSGIILSKRGSFMTVAQFQILMKASPVMECLECPKMVLMKMDLDLFQHCQEVVFRLVSLQSYTYKHAQSSAHVKIHYLGFRHDQYLNGLKMQQLRPQLP